MLIDLPTDSILAQDSLTPRKIVELLDRYIVGQAAAKRAVAIALRNRARRRVVPEGLREEIYPKNIIMIGPTGVGKTEIARRLAKLTDAPFYKVEASKFTEVGYVGRDVDSMIRDLVEISVGQIRRRRNEEVRPQAEANAEERLLDLLLPGLNDPPPRSRDAEGNVVELRGEADRKSTREKFRLMLRDGKLEDRVVEPEFREGPNVTLAGFGISPEMGLDQLGIDLKDMIERIAPQQRKRKKATVRDARPLIVQEEADKLIEMDAVIHEAIRRVEESGVIFLDEVDKIVGREAGHGPDVSREGVQRDILPIVEGSTVVTKYGMVRTDHILFIAAGAFHSVKPSDLIPELQGRFPIRVELSSLGAEDFKRILTEPDNSLLKQYKALLATEGVDLDFSADAIEEIADMAAQMNQRMEDIGARRLHTVVEKILEDISFNAPELEEKSMVINGQLVRERLAGIIADTDLSKYIL